LPLGPIGFVWKGLPAVIDCHHVAEELILQRYSGTLVQASQQ